jgi:hypothetical protein
VGKVSNNKALTWPAGRKTFCGEAFDASPLKYLKPGKGFVPSKSMKA